MNVSGDLPLRGNIFAARTPDVVVLETHAPTLAVDTGQVGAVALVALVGVLAVPAEAADGQSLDGRNPKAADNILEVVLVRMVDALTVKDAHLIVKPLVAISGREEVALKLGTHVAAGTLVTIGTVIDGSQFEGSLRIVAEAHVERAQGILETDGALELTELDP